MENIKLNLGCDNYPLEGFVNIDKNPIVNPDLVLDVFELDSKFKENSIDFIYAGHIFEHFKYKDSLKVMEKCFKVLKPNRCMISVVPDYTKCEDIDRADRVILGEGAHRILFNSERLKGMLIAAGFRLATEVTTLLEIPYILVPNMYDPQPEPWQTAYISMKI